MTTRENAFAALYAILSNVTWGSGSTWAFHDRRVRLFKDCAQPAMFLVSIDDDVSKTGQAPYIQTFKANVIIYQSSGSQLSVIPQQLDNQILDAVISALTPAPPQERLTLGGLVYNCKVSGRIKKVPGDLDGQALITIPIDIICP